MRRNQIDGRGVSRYLLPAVLLLVACLVPGMSRARAPDAGDKEYDYGPGGHKFRHNIGLLDLMITNIGVIGNRNWIEEFGAGWRNGEYLYAAAMWIGAVASDNLAYVSTGAYEYELLPSQDPVDTIYPSFEGSVHGNRPGFSSQPDDDRDGEVDEDPLNGKDDDGDGRIDEDFAAISQQMFSCEFWDYTEEAQARLPEHRPLNIRIHQESYAWSTEGASEFVGFDFKIVNDGFELLRRVYLGFFVDSDVGPRTEPGYWYDDGGAYYTSDTTVVDQSIAYSCIQSGSGTGKDCSNQQLHLDMCYMYDIPDDGTAAKGGDVPGYFGGMFLGHTTDPFGERAPAQVTVHTARFFSGSNAYPDGDPSNDTERYDLLQSAQKPMRPTTQPDDYRYCFSAGPFSELGPGESLLLQVAFVIGLGKQGLLNNAITAQRIYNGRWRDVDGDPFGGGDDRTGIDGRETCLQAAQVGEPLIWRDPCDSIAPISRTIKETACIPDNYVDNDCDCCTPLFFSSSEAFSGLGLETLIHWTGTVAPPPPATNLDSPTTAIVPSGDRSITVAWDNESELHADAVSGVISFAGYRIWRVEGWNRPVGSAGPAPEDWQLLVDLSRSPEDSLGPDSPYYLRKFRNEVDSLEAVRTGATGADSVVWRYPVGRYTYRDTVGLKNGMIYFYDVTAYSAERNNTTGNMDRLEGRPFAVEENGVYPRWSVRPKGDLANIYVVPNPYIAGRNPDGWDLTPSNADPTGTKLAFVGLPDDRCTVKIYTLSGDLVRVLDNEADGGRRHEGAVFWNLISRNGQDIVAGIYLYLVECGGKSKVGRFVVVR